MKKAARPDAQSNHATKCEQRMKDIAENVFGQRRVPRDEAARMLLKSRVCRDAVNPVLYTLQDNDDRSGAVPLIEQLAYLLDIGCSGIVTTDELCKITHAMISDVRSAA